jgi:hypothetical protein
MRRLPRPTRFGWIFIAVMVVLMVVALATGSTGPFIVLVVALAMAGLLGAAGGSPSGLARGGRMDLTEQDIRERERQRRAD